MNRFTTAFLVVVLMISCNNEKPVNIASTNTTELLTLEHKWLEAEFSLDTAYLSSIMDSTFFSISEEGVKNKNEELVSVYNNIRQRQMDSIFIDSFRLDSPLVNIYDNAAVVTFIVHSSGRNKTVAREKRTRFYDVWINRNGKWKAVSSQGTPL